MPGLGFLHDHPDAIASQTSPRHWPLSLLISGAPVIPSSYLDPDIAPAALDQDGIGACVAFAAETIKNAQEHADWGKWLFASGAFGTPTTGNPTGAYLAYRWLKLGTPDGSFPGDGIPTAEGSYPEAVWKMAKVYGLPDATGKLHKITAYYAQPINGLADIAIVQAAIMQTGPVNIATPWPANWFTAPVGPDYKMPTPSGNAGGHSYACVGWETYGGELYLTFLNQWGTSWGSKQGIFRYPASRLFAAPLGPNVAWQVTDRIDAPIPPVPPPGGTMLTLTDKTARTVDSTVGVQLWRADGTTPLVKLSSGVTGMASPAKYADAAGAAYYSLVISSGGIPQLAWIKAADTHNVVLVGTDPAAIEAARKAGVASGAKAVKEAAEAEALLLGG